MKSSSSSKISPNDNAGSVGADAGAEIGGDTGAEVDAAVRAPNGAAGLGSANGAAEVSSGACMGVDTASFDAEGGLDSDEAADASPWVVAGNGAAEVGSGACMGIDGSGPADGAADEAAVASSCVVNKPSRFQCGRSVANADSTNMEEGVGNSDAPS